MAHQLTIVFYYIRKCADLYKPPWYFDRLLLPSAVGLVKEESCQGREDYLEAVSPERPLPADETYSDAEQEEEGDEEEEEQEEEEDARTEGSAPEEEEEEEEEEDEGEDEEMEEGREIISFG